MSVSLEAANEGTPLGGRDQQAWASPRPLLDELLAPHRRQQSDPRSVNSTVRHLTTRSNLGRQGEVDLPNSSQTA